MSDQAIKLRRCSRCGAAVDSCAFCDEPGCPAITCYRCVSVAFVDRRTEEFRVKQPNAGGG